MGIFVHEDTKLVVQGITGGQGRTHTKFMLEYGTDVVAGVTPGKGGDRVHGVPVYNTVRQAREETGANTSIIFVPSSFAKDAAIEAIEADMNPVVIITESIPIHDSAVIMQFAEQHSTTVIGPNTPGIITPGETKVGIMPNHIFKPGAIGLVSRSGTLTYEIVNAIVRRFKPRPPVQPAYHVQKIKHGGCFLYGRALPPGFSQKIAEITPMRAQVQNGF